MYPKMLFVLMLAAQPAPGEEWDRARADAAKKTDALVKSLGDDDLGTEPKRREELLACLRAARVFPDPRMTPILLKHLANGPKPPGAWDNPLRMTLEERVPVLGALASIGPRLIPEVLQALRVTESADEAKWLTLLVFSIYRDGGFRAEMAVQRLELELWRTKAPEERKNLLRAIKRLRPTGDSKGKA